MPLPVVDGVRGGGDPEVVRGRECARGGGQSGRGRDVGVNVARDHFQGEEGLLDTSRKLFGCHGD